MTNYFHLSKGENGRARIRLGAALMAILTTSLCSFQFDAAATHLRAGQITARRIGCTLTFEITITVYTDTESGIQFGGDYLQFGDGQSVFIDNRPSTPIPGTPNLGFAKYTTTHTYASEGASYIISYSESYRNANILNMFNSVQTRFYLETRIDLDPFLNDPLTGCNSTPVMLVPPIDDGCTGQAFYHNPGAYDPDADSLSYELVTPFKARGTVVDRYLYPDDRKFYAALDYNRANEEGTAPPDITIDPVTGTIVWDAPGAAGEYNIAFIVREWRIKDGVWYPMGFVRRDMQIIIADCPNNRPELIIPDDTCVTAGTNLTALIRGTDDPDHDQVKLEAYSEILNLKSDSAYYTPFPPIFQPTDPEAELNFYWSTKCTHVREQPYQVVFKISDKPPTGPSLVTFGTWRLNVVPPAPIWEDASVDLARRYATLQWEPYPCAADVSNIKLQIWRKVDGVNFISSNCETGMQDYLGYELIATVNGDETSYTDTNNGSGLAVGAAYCYRMVAIFPSPKRGESYLSEDICIESIRADAPVITNVSVERTGNLDGEVFVKWMHPFEIEPGQFPEPYKYVVQRSESLAGPFVSDVHPGQLDAKEVTDAGLNTKDKRYFYRILLIVPAVSPDTPVDTSAVASTVRLNVAPQKGAIDLSWNALVPWSNQIQTAPHHDVYRGDAGAAEITDLAYYDKVNVFVNGQLYLDDNMGGKLDDKTIYCYQVVTRGGYGNSAIPEPLTNYSQIICAQPRDTIPPCAPVVSIDVTDCAAFLNESCDFSEFENTIRWNKECASDVISYNVYASGTLNGGYSLLKVNVADTFFVDKGLSSFARCYRVTAVDRSGNESELSEPGCNENCPYYELPNIFTPNNDQYNDFFRAFSRRGDVNCDGEEDCDPVPTELIQRCARFVEKVKLQVFNRWGKEVYSYESGGERTIHIDWDGRDNTGRELATAVYYYSAEVTFESADPSKRIKVFKGWVHLVR